MKGKGVKVTKFIKDFSLEVLHEGADMQEAMLTVSDLNRPGLQFQGFYDYFDPHRLQIIGRAEHMYLQGLCSEDRRKCFDDLFLYGIPALIISRELECFPECMDAAKTYGRTVLRSTETTVDFTSHVIEYLNRALAPYVTRHGVLMDVYGIGVLLMGDSGIGKSELAVDLIMRGHRLVSDDAVEIHRISNELEGTAPEVIRHFIELRGVGIINVRQMFGMRAVKTSSLIDMIIKLEPWDDKKVYDRWGMEDQYETILDVQVPILTVPVRPGRALASIVEVAAMNNRYRYYGHNAAAELASRVDAVAEGKQLDFGQDYPVEPKRDSK